MGIHFYEKRTQLFTEDWYSGAYTTGQHCPCLLGTWLGGEFSLDIQTGWDQPHLVDTPKLVWFKKSLYLNKPPPPQQQLQRVIPRNEKIGNCIICVILNCMASYETCWMYSYKLFSFLFFLLLINKSRRCNEWS